MVKEAKKRQGKEFGYTMEEDSRGDTKLLYRAINNLRQDGTNKVKYLEDGEENVLVTHIQIMETWKQDLTEVLKANTKGHEQRTTECINKTTVIDEIIKTL